VETVSALEKQLSEAHEVSTPIPYRPHRVEDEPVEVAAEVK
jgi:hypothetical protein